MKKHCTRDSVWRIESQKKSREYEQIVMQRQSWCSCHFSSLIKVHSMYLSPNVRAFWFRWVADPVWMTPRVGPMFPFPEHTCSRDDGVSPRMGLVIRLNFRRCVFVNTCFRTCIRLEFSKLCTFKNMPITTSMSWQHPFLNVMQICLFACPRGLLPIRFGVPAEPVGENERKRTFPLLLLFGSCLIAHESPNEH